jgi:hypothetical protein
VNVLKAGDDAFGEQKSQHEVAVVAGRAHDDGKRITAKTHLERRFDGHTIAHTFRARSIHPDDVDVANGGAIRVSRGHAEIRTCFRSCRSSADGTDPLMPPATGKPWEIL